MAAAHNMSIVARGGFGGQAAGDRGALADNYVLSRCAVLVQSRESTFLRGTGRSGPTTVSVIYGTPTPGAVL